MCDNGSKMTIDERLEALTQSVELLHLSQSDTSEKIRHLAVIAEQNEVRAGQMIQSIQRHDQMIQGSEARAADIMDSIQRLDKMMQGSEARARDMAARALDMMEAIKRLAHIADIHDTRIERLEG